MRSAWRTVENRCEIRIVVQCARRGEDALEDLGFAAHVELRGRLVEQHDAGAQPHGAERPRERDPLPLPAGEVGAARRSRATSTVSSSASDRRARALPAPRESTSSGAPSGATLSRSGSSKRMKSWKTAVTRERHAGEIELAQVDAVDLDRAGLRVVEPAEQLGERRLAGAVLSDDRQRRPGGNREVEAVEHRTAAGPGRRTSRRGSGSRAPAARSAVACPGRERARRAPSRFEPQHGGDRRGGAVERPAEPAERDQRHADRRLRVDHELAEVEAAARSAAAGQRPEHDDVRGRRRAAGSRAPAARAAASPRTAADAAACGAR